MKKLIAILPHLNIIMACTVLTFLIIDRFNSAMQFIENDITKGILFLFVIVTIINSIILMVYQRKK